MRAIESNFSAFLPPRRPLAAGIATLLLAAGPAAHAADTWIVSSCGDTNTGDLPTKTGTLRFGVANAASGDTVDLSGLSCPSSKISVSTGEIFVSQASLTIKGPTATTLTLDGSGLPSGATGPNDSRIFTHTGTGTLTLQSLRLTGGHVYHTAGGYPSRGGCVFSAGNITLTYSTVTGCNTYSASDTSQGGGVFAVGNVTLKYSTVSQNTTSGGVTSRGGGIRADGGVGMKYSTVSGNKAYGPVGNDLAHYKYTIGGGLSAGKDIGLRHSTVSNNYAAGSFGAIDAFGSVSNAPNSEVAIYQSTISGNRAGKLVGGVYSNAATFKLYNSTVAFNTAQVGRVGTAPYSFFAQGVTLSGFFTDVAATLQSSIVSNNSYGSAEFDLSTVATDTHTVTFNAAPANNFVRTRIDAPGFPSDTIQFSCPLLGPLRDNGGPTWTHALFSTSPAINAGNNTLNYTEDQRGRGSDAVPYLYPRVSDGQADIGAYEVNHDDVIYNSGFDGCLDLI